MPTDVFKLKSWQANFDRFRTNQFLHHAANLAISIGQQRLYLISGESQLCNYSVSTSKFGTGSREGSLKTPLGMHSISDKIGGGCVSGTVFRGRENTGQIVQVDAGSGAESAEDLITTRILRLKGLEPGVNCGPGIDSYERYIYIHGTPHESMIGQPASQGCIRMTNLDVMDLFDHVEIGALVLIEE